MNALKDQAINSSKNGDWETGLKILDAQQEVMRKLIDKGHDLAVSMIFSEVNRAYALENLKRQEEAVRSWRRAYEMKTEFSENGDTRKPLGIAAYHVAEAEKDRKQASALYMEAASLLEPHCDFRPAAIMYFLSCLHYAYSIDEVESEKAVGIYRKALSTMRRYHLDENQNLRIAIATTCNNLAWVLWNRLNSNAFTDVGRHQLSLFGRCDGHSARAIMKAHGDGVLAGNGADFTVDFAVVGHRAGHFGAAGVKCFALQHFCHSGGGIAGVSVFCAGTGNGGTGLVVCRDTFCQLVRGNGICGKVKFRFLADNNLVYVFIGHCSTPLL